MNRNWPEKLKDHFPEVLSRFSFPIEPAYLFKTVEGRAADEADTYERMFDRIFTEFLAQIREIPELTDSALLGENANEAFHDLSLYLAWDRMCAYCSALFENGAETNSMGLYIFKMCLIESYEHITLQGRSAPSFHRLAEALFAYEMREEHLQKHSEEDWTILSKSSQVLNSWDELLDRPYIDLAVVVEPSIMTMLTKDSQERIQLAWEFANLMFKKCEFKKLRFLPLKVTEKEGLREVQIGV